MIFLASCRTRGQCHSILVRLFGRICPAERIPPFEQETLLGVVDVVKEEVVRIWRLLLGRRETQRVEAARVEAPQATGLCREARQENVLEVKEGKPEPLLVQALGGGPARKPKWDLFRGSKAVDVTWSGCSRSR